MTYAYVAAGAEQTSDFPAVVAVVYSKALNAFAAGCLACADGAFAVLRGEHFCVTACRKFVAFLYFVISYAVWMQFAVSCCVAASACRVFQVVRSVNFFDAAFTGSVQPIRVPPAKAELANRPHCLASPAPLGAFGEGRNVVSGMVFFQNHGLFAFFAIMARSIRNGFVFVELGYRLCFGATRAVFREHTKLLPLQFFPCFAHGVN
jgi:hypothetical protein